MSEISLLRGGQEKHKSDYEKFFSMASQQLPPSLPADKYIAKKLHSQGSHGYVFLAYSHMSHETVAVKVEKRKKNNETTQQASIFSPIQWEVKMLKYLQGLPGVPKLLDYDCTKTTNSYFAMTLLGKDMTAVLKRFGGRLPSKTVLRAAAQILKVLKGVHERGVVHRDIKPENILISMNRQDLFLVDYGTAKPFRIEGETLKHIPFEENKYFVGTYRYASRAAHFGKEQGRKDDLESLGYVLVFLCKGGLPWQDQKYEQNGHFDQTVIGQIKETMSCETLCEGLPTFFSWLLEYTRGLKFEDDPGYDLIEERLALALADENQQSENVIDVDWGQISFNSSNFSMSIDDRTAAYQSTNVFLSNSSCKQIQVQHGINDDHYRKEKTNVRHSLVNSSRQQDYFHKILDDERKDDLQVGEDPVNQRNFLFQSRSTAAIRDFRAQSSQEEQKQPQTPLSNEEQFRQSKKVDYFTESMKVIPQSIDLSQRNNNIFDERKAKYYQHQDNNNESLDSIGVEWKTTGRSNSVYISKAPKLILDGLAFRLKQKERLMNKNSRK